MDREFRSAHMTMAPHAPHLRRARLAIFALFFCVRLVHLAELVDAPALVQHHWPDSDLFAFDRWAQQVAHGDVLSRLPQRPLTDWQRDVAVQWQKLVPTAPLAHAPPEQAAQQLWFSWQGGQRFYQEPLFPYLLAGLYTLTGALPLVALLLQALLGGLGLWLLMDATRRLLGEREAVVAGLLATLCGPLAYYESLLLRETLAVATVWLLVRQWAVAHASSSWRLWLPVGLSAGLALLSRSSILPFVLALFAASLLNVSSRRQRVVGWSLGLALPLGLLVVRNALVDAPVLSLVGGGIFAFLMGNSTLAVPWQGWILDAPLIAKLLAKSDGEPARLALATLMDHPSLTSIVSLELAKLPPLLHAFEIPSNASFVYYRQHAPVLWLLPVDFALALPLALLGVVVAVRDRRARVLVVLALVQLLPPLVLQPLSRFRLGLLAACLPLASLALVWLHDRWMLGAPRRVLALGAVLLTTVLLMHRPLPVDVAPTRAVDHAVAWQFWALPRLQQAAQRQDHAGVAEAMTLYLRGEPADLATWSRPLRSEQVRIAARYAEAHNVDAQALQMLGRADEAAQHRAASEALHALVKRQNVR